MFEQYTEDFILNRMKQNVKNGIDTKEGTFTHDILSPSANELAEIYAKMDYAIKQSFLSDATGDNLTKKAKEFNVYRKPKQKAVGYGIFYGSSGAVVSENTIVSCGNLQFITKEAKKIEEGKTSVKVLLEALQSGPSYNISKHSLKTINTSLTNITGIDNDEVFEGGKDEETDEELRKRAFEYISEPSCSGNSNHYKQWCKTVNGVGAVKVIDAFDGPNTVEVIILDSNNNIANDALLKNVEDYIRSNMPLGVVTLKVATARIRQINIMVDIKQYNTVDFEEVKEKFNSAINKYFNDSAFNKQKVSYNKIVSIFENLVNDELIEDYRAVRINSMSIGEDLILDIDEIPVLQEVTVNDYEN